ncbi:hypothetical protein BpHYR1_000486 [Brachionus plicatilis]|uniref:Uncharacterized protein n=1 Tax=Brachionus plicatilis TaxID=10195 RepID=A0A3M7SWP4_BRAPC|nr:hypothetical protein BpHYR1_000486 [Brachionus plicatilis]
MDFASKFKKNNKKGLVKFKTYFQSTMADEKGEDRQEVRTPLYRLPQGLKRIELENLKKPDPSYNKTASSIQIEPSRVQSPKNYTSKMHEKNLSDNTLLKTGQPYTNEILGGNSKHIFSKEKNKIYLENGKTFTKMYQCVYPAEFTAWLNGVKVVETGKPEKPVKGLKKWKKYPELIDNILC